MCTAATYQTKDHYFGRTLDLEYSYDEKITVAPRNFPFHFRNAPPQPKHYAIIGMACVMEGYPLYYDATNEKGLSMAGLNFPENAKFFPISNGKYNIAPYEFIPWILGQCSTLKEARELLKNLNLTNTDFSREFPAAPLHWMISDKSGSVTVESVKEGLKVYDNPVGILTNNPPFDFQMTNLTNYMNLTCKEPENRFSEKIPLKTYCKGMGAIGLPGDLSSASRFVRATFTKLCSISGCSESESISQFFHILGSVAQTRGNVRLGNGKYEITVYTSCCNTDKGIYYYTTYENNQISGVDMHRENLNGDCIISYPLIQKQQVNMQN